MLEWRITQRNRIGKVGQEFAKPKKVNKSKTFACTDDLLRVIYSSAVNDYLNKLHLFRISMTRALTIIHATLGTGRQDGSPLLRLK